MRPPGGWGLFCRVPRKAPIWMSSLLLNIFLEIAPQRGTVYAELPCRLGSVAAACAQGREQHALFAVRHSAVCGLRGKGGCCCRVPQRAPAWIYRLLLDIFLELAPQRGAVYAEPPGRLGSVAAACAQGLEQSVLFAVRHGAVCGLRGKGAVVAACPRGYPFGCLAYFSIYFWSLRHSVVRSMPSLRAAWVRFPRMRAGPRAACPFRRPARCRMRPPGGRGRVLPEAGAAAPPQCPPGTGPC